jgi:phosphoglycolate phosphatase
MLRNIIFDWSGTLVDDLPAVWKATNHVLEQARRSAMTLEQFRAEFCLPFTIFYSRHVPDVAMEQLEEWFHGRFRQVQDSVCALPHAREFLEFCRERGARTFLLSTVHPDHFKVQAHATDLGQFIDTPYVGVLDKREKIHRILEEHALEAEETLFIGDMQHDIDTARHGGVHSCAVLTGYNTLDQLRGADPDLIVEHLGELKEIMEQTGFRLPGKSNTAGRGLHPVVTVGALIFDGSDRVLMVRTHKWSNLWGIPGGKTKYGETSDEALRREIREETALEIAEVEFVLVQDCIHSPEFYRDAHFVLLNYTCRMAQPAEVCLNDEAREFRWVSIDEALGMRINEPTRKLLNLVRAERCRSREAAQGTKAI